MSLHRRRFLAQCLGISVILGFGMSSAEAAPKNNQNQQRPLSKKGKVSELPKVKSVDAKTIRVGDKLYELSEFADVIVNGEKASLKDVKPGMQAMVTGGVKKYGKTRAETLYKATRIVARSENDLQKKANATNKKRAEAARKANQRNNRNRRR
jgi:hypothetical protein